MINVRKNNISKAILLLNKQVKEDGDLRRSIERRFFVSKSEQRRIDKSKAVVRERKRKIENSP